MVLLSPYYLQAEWPMESTFALLLPIGINDEDDYESRHIRYSIPLDMPLHKTYASLSITPLPTLPHIDAWPYPSALIVVFAMTREALLLNEKIVFAFD
jgi:hypothetical protein